MIPVYVAAPYGAPTQEARAWHVARAELLGELAAACGLAPVVVHRRIHDHEWGPDEDPASRAAGMEVTLAICLETVKRGLLWVLERDDGTLSPGTQAEEGAASQAVGQRVHPELARWLQEEPALHAVLHEGWLLGATWAVWRQRVIAWAPHLRPAWEALSSPPRWTLASMAALRAQVSGAHLVAPPQSVEVEAWRGVWAMADRVELGEASAARRWRAAALREIDLHRDQGLQTAEAYAVACEASGLAADALALRQTREEVVSGRVRPNAWAQEMVRLALVEAR